MFRPYLGVKSKENLFFSTAVLAKSVSLLLTKVHYTAEQLIRLFLGIFLPRCVLSWSPSVAGPGEASGSARSVLHVEVALVLTQLVRNTNERTFPALAERELNLFPQCNVLLLRVRKTSLPVPR